MFSTVSSSNKGYVFSKTLILEPTYLLSEGSGLVGVAAFSSLKDYQIIKKHNLDYESVLNNNLLTEKEILELINKKIIRKEGQIEIHCQVHTERSSCNQQISYVNTEQLYLKIEDFKKDFLNLFEGYKILNKTHKPYLVNWCKNLRDWCISRQYQNGTKIELYQNKERLSINFEPKAKRYTSVLDCWFESALSFLLVKNYYQVPIANLLRVQGYQISRTWLLYTYIMGYYLDFDMRDMKVLLTGLILNQDGRKFSKSNNSSSTFFKTIGALRLWSVSFLPSKTEKRISPTQILLFEKRVSKWNQYIKNIIIDDNASEVIPEVLLIQKKLEDPLSGIYLEDLLKIGSFLKKPLDKVSYDIIIKLLKPYLEKESPLI